MSIATKTGDGGETSLLNGTRVSKNHARVWAYGSVDELNSVLGICRAHAFYVEDKTLLLEIQKRLVHLMAELASDGSKSPKSGHDTSQCIQVADVDALTVLISDKEVSGGGGFRGWQYPGDTIAQAFFDQARSGCRRAERYVFALIESGSDVRPELPQYLNRLSDLLWLLEREYAAE